MQKCTSQERKLIRATCKMEVISLGEKSRCLILVQLTVCVTASALLSAIPVLRYDDC